MIDFDFKTGKKDIQLFARLIPIVLLIWGTVSGILVQEPRWSGVAHYWFYGIAVLIFFWGWISPFTLKPVYLVWMVITRCIAWLLTTLVLGLVFYIGFTLTGLVLRLMGKDPLNRRLDKEAASYWHKREPGRIEKVHYERQF